MVRFQNQKKSRKNRRVFLSICVFLVILLLFISGIDSFSDNTRRHQKESLERALNRSIVYCYATEGTYPESLEDLKAHYGLTYDEDLFSGKKLPIASGTVRHAMPFEFLFSGKSDFSGMCTCGKKNPKT